MLSLNLAHTPAKPYTILCLGAHCDDIEIGCGGTLLKLIEQNHIGFVKWVVFTSTEMRAAEAKESAAHFLKNVPQKDIVVNTYKDGFLHFMGYDIKNYFEQLKTSCTPDLIFTHYRNDRHQDHRLISDLTWNTYRNHLILEYEIPKYDGDLGIPNVFVSLETRYAEQKSEILLECFKSQQGKHWFDKETFFALLRLRGMESASKYAEAFHGRKVLFT